MCSISIFYVHVFSNLYLTSHFLCVWCQLQNLCESVSLPKWIENNVMNDDVRNFSILYVRLWFIFLSFSVCMLVATLLCFPCFFFILFLVSILLLFVSLLPFFSIAVYQENCPYSHVCMFLTTSTIPKSKYHCVCRLNTYMNKNIIPFLRWIRFFFPSSLYFFLLYLCLNCLHNVLYALVLLWVISC